MERQPVFLDDTVVPCSYLPGRVFRSENFLYPGISADQLDGLLAGGYRHFGYYFFRPFCRRCHQCIPLRVPVGRFEFGASFRRVIARNKGISAVLQRPSPSEEAFLIYRKHKKKFADKASENYDAFLSSFFHPFDFSYQLSMRLGGKLLGVAHLDITRSSLSSIYCYYDTDYGAQSLGTLAILKSMEIARSMSLGYLYLGYYVHDCSHMNYKIRFRPNQALVTDGKWKDFSGGEADSFSPSMARRGFRPKNRFHSPFDGERDSGVYSF